jgi:hypothetical protein
MKLLTYTLLTQIFLSGLLFASDGDGQAADKQYATAAARIVTDPVSGEQVYTDQLMIAFKESVAEKERKIILDNYNIKIVSSAPSLNIYHVTFSNPESNLSKLYKKRDLLERNPKILYVYPRRQLRFSNETEELVANETVQRSGEITLTSLSGPAVQYKPKTVDDAINQHHQALTSCIDRKKRLSKTYHGKISFRLTLSASGDVTNVRITRATIRDKQLTSCLVNKINDWRDFPADPKKRDNRTVNFSFEF